MPSSQQPYQALPEQEDHVDDTGRSGNGDENRIPLRDYADAHSSDDEDDGLLNEQRQSSRTKHRRGVPSNGGQSEVRSRSRRPWQRLCCCCRFSNTCLIISALFAAAIVALLGGGGLWVYKIAPKDGLSPPWYPTPLGGTVDAWQESYDKAKDMVGRMTLLEKVNITTGTG